MMDAKEDLLVKKTTANPTDHPTPPSGLPTSKTMLDLAIEKMLSGIAKPHSPALDPLIKEA